MIRLPRFLVSSVLVSLLGTALAAQAPPLDGRGAASFPPADLREWLTYIASDDLQGRALYSEGLGLAAAYIAEHLEKWGVQPAGDHGGYFQTVKIVSVKTTSRASITLDVNGQKRTFKDGEGVVFPRNMGGRQTITSDAIQFAAYGLQIASASIDDYAGGAAKDKVIVYLESFGLLHGRSRKALDQGALAVITVGPTSSGSHGARTAHDDPGDFTTAERYDQPLPPALMAQDDFFEFLFSGSDVKYAELRQKADKQEPLPSFALKGVTITIGVDADYAIVRTRLTRNVAGIVPGADAVLKDTYVAFGAHYDHIGYSEVPTGTGFGGISPGGCLGQTWDTARPGDSINNGADDDGSGTVALMALARAFAAGPRPKRSLLFVWHTGEEAGLYGSRYNADYPVVPIDKIVTVLNVDMIGRNRCDRPGEENTLYLVGSDRVSTELHNVSEEANAGQARPMTLDYELNDPADPESLYTRSDHFSYASKGIPVIFYTTGLHRDYHYLTDEVEKIDFAKMARVTQLVYATGTTVANLDHPPARDNKGPRKGKGSTGRIER